MKCSVIRFLALVDESYRLERWKNPDKDLMLEEMGTDSANELELQELVNYDWAYRMTHGQFNPEEAARMRDPEAWFYNNES